MLTLSLKKCPKYCYEVPAEIVEILRKSSERQRSLCVGPLVNLTDSEDATIRQALIDAGCFKLGTTQKNSPLAAEETPP